MHPLQGIECVHTNKCLCIKLKQQLFTYPEPGRSSVLRYTAVEIGTCAFKTSCSKSPRACHCDCIFDTISVAWNERAGQLAAGGVSQSGSSEFDLRWVHDNLSVLSWVYVRFPVPEHQDQTNKYVRTSCVFISVPIAGHSIFLATTFFIVW